MSTEGVDRQQQKIREFMSLLPLSGSTAVIRVPVTATASGRSTSTPVA